jgi:hypothetical protein
MREVLLFIHPTLGILGMLGALWVFVELLSPDAAALRRTRIASVLVAGAFVLTWLSGGIWDSAYYDADRAVMERGAWVLAGDTTMETKEHLIVLILLLAAYLPLLAFGADLRRLQAVRLPLMTAAGLIVLNTLAMEGFGAVLAQSVHVGAAAMLAGQ